MEDDFELSVLGESDLVMYYDADGSDLWWPDKNEDWFPRDFGMPNPDWSLE